MINSCNNCETCPFEDKGQVEYQEMHVTVTVLPENLDDFETQCIQFGGKPITIKLPTFKNKEEMQTMSSISFKGTKEDAFKKAKEFVMECDTYAKIERVKLECSIFHCDFEDANGYFEGHLVVDTTPETLYGLGQLAKSMDSHLSRNVFKENVYMVTYRSNDSKKKFEEHMNALNELVSKNFNVRKCIKEFCYYDTNKNLDDNWIKSKE